MDGSWVVAAGRSALYVFYVLVLASLAGIAIRRTWSRSRGDAGASRSSPRPPGNPNPAPWGGRWLRFLLEYVGNIEAPGTGTGPRDRRRNRQARLLMERLQEELVTPDASASERERVIRELRESVQAVEPDGAG